MESHPMDDFCGSEFWVNTNKTFFILNAFSNDNFVIIIYFHYIKFKHKSLVS